MHPKRTSKDYFNINGVRIKTETSSCNDFYTGAMYKDHKFSDRQNELRKRAGIDVKKYISRKNQIKYILDENKDLENQIIIGDFNYGPHVTEYREDYQVNWQEIVYMVRDNQKYKYSYIHLRDRVARTINWIGSSRKI